MTSKQRAVAKLPIWCTLVRRGGSSPLAKGGGESEFASANPDVSQQYTKRSSFLTGPTVVLPHRQWDSVDPAQHTSPISMAMSSKPHGHWVLRQRIVDLCNGLKSQQ